MNDWIDMNRDQYSMNYMIDPYSMTYCTDEYEQLNL